MTYEKFIDIIKETARSTTDDVNIDNLLLREELGIDSILLVSIIIQIEDEIQEEISFEKMKNIDVRTPWELWNVMNLNA
ncbi:MAG: phosphopantetheine-binding protein [Lacrimispora saccharolytica]